MKLNLKAHSDLRGHHNNRAQVDTKSARVAQKCSFCLGTEANITQRVSWMREDAHSSCPGRTKSTTLPCPSPHVATHQNPMPSRRFHVECQVVCSPRKFFVLLLQYLYRSPPGGQRHPILRELSCACEWVKAGLGNLTGPTSKPVAEAWDSLQRRVLLYFGRTMFVFASYRIVAVQVWYVQGRSRDDPSIDLPLLGAFAVMLMVSTFPCFRTRMAMDLVFWLLQFLSFISMLLARTDHMFQVLLLTPGRTT